MIKLLRILPLSDGMDQALESFRSYLRNRSVADPEHKRGYVRTVSAFLKWQGCTGDSLIGEAKSKSGEERRDILAEHALRIEQWGGMLLDKGLTKGSVNTYFTHLRLFYHSFKLNDLPLEPYRNAESESKDRIPSQVELQRMVEFAGSVRDRFVISALALGGFRLGTLVKLQYRHVNRDLEAGRDVIHLHVEKELMKGKRRPCDCFIGAEAVQYLRQYIREREQGSLRSDGRGLQPEVLEPESPLLRDSRSRKVKPLTKAAVYRIFSKILGRVELREKIRDGVSKRYALHPHSLRKYFRTSMLKAGIDSEMVRMMIGHKPIGQDTAYLRLTPEDLRGEYEKAGLRVIPDTMTREELEAHTDQIREQLRSEIEEATREDLEKTREELKKTHIDEIQKLTSQVQDRMNEVDVVKQILLEQEPEVKVKIAKRYKELIEEKGIPILKEEPD